MPMRPPCDSAASYIASLGLSTGKAARPATRSIALPKAEQVNNNPFAPIIAA